MNIVITVVCPKMAVGVLVCHRENAEANDINQIHIARTRNVYAI